MTALNIALESGVGSEAADGEPQQSTGQGAKHNRAARAASHSQRGRGGRGTTGARARGSRATGPVDATAALQAAATLDDALNLWGEEGDVAASDAAESGELEDGHDMPALPGLPSRVQSVATELPSREQSDGAEPPSRADRSAYAAPGRKPPRRVSFAATAGSDSDAQDDAGLSTMVEPGSVPAKAPRDTLVHPRRRGRKQVPDEAVTAVQANGDTAARSGAVAEVVPPKRKRKRTSEPSNGRVSGGHNSAPIVSNLPKRNGKVSLEATISGDAARSGPVAKGASQTAEAGSRKRGRCLKTTPAEAEADASGITDGQASSADARKRKAGRPPKSKPVELMPDIPTGGSPKRRRGRPPKAKPPTQLDGQQEVAKRKRGRPTKAKPSAAGSEQASTGSVADGGVMAASAEPQLGAAQAASQQAAELDTAALLRASQLQMAAIEAALAEDD